MREAKSFNPQSETSAGIDLVSLLNPAEHFSSPSQVLEAPTLTEQEKRTILANWASDQYAVESVPGLRELPGSHALVALQDILAALKPIRCEYPTGLCLDVRSVRCVVRFPGGQGGAGRQVDYGSFAGAPGLDRMGLQYA